MDEEEKISFYKSLFISELKMCVFVFIFFIVFIFLFILFSNSIFIFANKNLNNIYFYVLFTGIILSGLSFLFSLSVAVEEYIIIRKIKNGTYSETKSVYTSKSRIELINNQIKLTAMDAKAVSFNIYDIKIIGEQTTSNGPFTDDWYLLFILNKTDWYQIPMYAENMQDVLKELSGILKAEVIGTLFYATSWKTNVIYPKEFQGKDLFLTEDGSINKKLILNPELLSIL